MNVRPAEPTEIDSLARLWFDVWHESHQPIMPAALSKLRTLDSFTDRLQALLPDIRVVGEVGSPTGFCIVRADELYQLFMSEKARGTGAAAALLADAEDRVTANGFATGWLACAINNDRAARFYEKFGWNRAKTETINVETSAGTFPLEIWRYEKAVKLS